MRHDDEAWLACYQQASFVLSPHHCFRLLPCGDATVAESCVAPSLGASCSQRTDGRANIFRKCWAAWHFMIASRECAHLYSIMLDRGLGFGSVLLGWYLSCRWLCLVFIAQTDTTENFYAGWVFWQSCTIWANLLVLAQLSAEIDNCTEWHIKCSCCTAAYCRSERPGIRLPKAIYLSNDSANTSGFYHCWLWCL